MAVAGLLVLIEQEIPEVREVEGKVHLVEQGLEIQVPHQQLLIKHHHLMGGEMMEDLLHRQVDQQVAAVQVV